MTAIPLRPKGPDAEKLASPRPLRFDLAHSEQRAQNSAHKPSPAFLAALRARGR